MPGSFPGRRGKRTGVEVIPEMVKRAREQAGLSQAQVAEPELTRAAIHLIETGKSRPSVRTLHLIARKTRKPISYFLASTDATQEQREAVEHLERLVATQEFADAIAYGESLLERQLGRDVEADVRFLLGRAYVRSQDGASAHPHLNRALDLYELIGDQLQIADVLNQTACALYLMDDSRALAVACRALDACDGLRPPQPELTVRTLMVLGMIYARMQDWHRAAASYERALGLVTSAPTIRNMGMLHDHLGMTYQRLGRFAEALRHARKASKLYQGTADPTDLFRAEHNLGWILLMQGELAAARPHLERALTICDERELRRYFRGIALLALVELHIALSELDRAQDRLNEAQDVLRELGERTREATAWRLSGRLHLRRHQYEEADIAFGKSTELFRSLDLPVDLFDAQVEHAEALILQGRVTEALQLQRDANTSARLAMLRVQTGGAEIVAAGWQR